MTTKGPECNTEIRNQGSRKKIHLKTETRACNGIRGWSRRQELSLGSKGSINETFREILGLEMAKRIAGSSVKIKKMSYWTLWWGRPPPK